MNTRSPSRVLSSAASRGCDINLACEQAHDDDAVLCDFVVILETDDSGVTETRDQADAMTTSPARHSTRLGVHLLWRLHTRRTQGAIAPTVYES